MSIKRDILLRIYLAFFAVCLLGVAILLQAFRIQFVEGPELTELADSLTTNYLPIEAERGNIIAEDGRLLATSLPYFEVRADLNADALTDKIFYESVDSLALLISNYKEDKSAHQYKQLLINARKTGNRYFLIARNVTYPELQNMKTWPLFRLGRYKGGLIVLQVNKRTMPYKMLAHRTIGYVREGIKPVGLEGYYDDELVGVRGKRLMQRIAGGTWIPVNDDNEINPENGRDVVTTIDMNLQDVAEAALQNALIKHRADHGSVIVMEVKTGKIKAVANLGLIDENTYWETYNYAIGEATEPGSTLKLAAMIALLEDGFVDIDDSIDLEGGTTEFHRVKMVDSEKHDYRNVSIREAFEISSNVGISKLIYQYYRERPEKFFDRLHELKLDQKVGIEIEGEASPLIKHPSDKGWSGTTLPWMSVGYEMALTPLQILTLYNAIANDGVMMKPYLVTEIQRHGKSIKKFDTQVVSQNICSKKTLSKVHELLIGVVENGTAKHLKSPYYSFAGKTGTAQIADKNKGYKRERIYQSSFAGYFPADDPMYSCIVVINGPKNGIYYGGYVAGPVFREIADKVFSNCIDMHEPVNQKKFFAEYLPVAKSGFRHDVSTIYEIIGVSCNYNVEKNWVHAEQKHNSMELIERQVVDGIIPDVRGMGLRDALYLLENLGLQVKFSGKGKVQKQFIRYGTKAIAGSEIILELA